MGKVWSMAKRPLIMFNIENRAHRVIAKDKPEMAPKYKVDVDNLQKVLQANPEIADMYSKKDAELDERLKSVYVDSIDPKIIEKNSKTPILSKERVEDFEFGIKEPDHVPVGRMKLRSVLKLISEFYLEKIPKEKLLATYKIDEKVLDNILKYHGVFDIHIPREATKQQEKLVEKYIDYKKLNG